MAITDSKLTEVCSFNIITELKTHNYLYGGRLLCLRGPSLCEPCINNIDCPCRHTSDARALCVTYIPWIHGTQEWGLCLYIHTVSTSCILAISYITSSLREM